MGVHSGWQGARAGTATPFKRRRPFSPPRVCPVNALGSLVGCVLGVVAILLAAPLTAAATPSFNPAVEYQTGSNPESVAVADFTGDGKPDLAVANACEGTVSVLINAGNGTYEKAVDYRVGGSPTGVAVGDFFGNGKLDLAVVNGTSEVTILPGNGNGTFGAASILRAFEASSYLRPAER
jgi:hypothetical protein